MIQKIFHYQLRHLILLSTLLVGVSILAIPEESGSLLWGMSSQFWFWLSIAVPILHQIYVWFVWRFELYSELFTKRLGVRRAFSLYSVGFSILFVSRLISIVISALSSRHSMAIPLPIVIVAVAVIVPLVVYLFYSVKRYFTIERAFGIDHFDRTYKVPFVKKGIFRFTNNGMYIYGFLILYVPALVLQSKPALIAALFNHLYIWVHYYCTELPDMKEIYGKTSKE